MNTQDIAELIVALATACIPVLATYIAKFIKSNKETETANNTAETIVSLLPALAKDAVIAMQKLGVTEYLTGVLKNSKAVAIVTASLKKFGFTSVDATTIENAVESAYASLVKDGTLSQYTQATEDSTSTSTSETASTSTSTVASESATASTSSSEASSTSASTSESTSTSTATSEVAK